MKIKEAVALSPAQAEEFERAVAIQNEAFARLLADEEAKAYAKQTSTDQLNANRANAQLSTGPRTELGKRIASRNAVRHGLTARHALLPAEDATVYANHCERFRRMFSPVGEREHELIQVLADTQWRLNRIPGLEMAIYAYGQCEYADLFPEVQDPAMRKAVLEMHTFKHNFRELTSLSLQETRLHRQYDRALAEFDNLQTARQQAEKREAATAAAAIKTAAANAAQPATATQAASANGFVFSHRRETPAALAQPAVASASTATPIRFERHGHDNS